MEKLSPNDNTRRKKVIITGAKGVVGSILMEKLGEKLKYDIIGLDLPECDLTHKE